MAIDIKHPGLLHKHLGIPEGEEIPTSALHEALKSGNPELAREANFALNAKKWNHKKAALAFLALTSAGIDFEKAASAAGMGLKGALKNELLTVPGDIAGAGIGAGLGKLVTPKDADDKTRHRNEVIGGVIGAKGGSIATMALGDKLLHKIPAAVEKVAALHHALKNAAKVTGENLLLSGAGGIIGQEIANDTASDEVLNDPKRGSRRAALGALAGSAGVGLGLSLARELSKKASEEHPLLQKFNNVLGEGTLASLDQDFSHLDNLDKTELVMEAEEHYGRELPDAEHQHLHSTRDIVNYFEKNAGLGTAATVGGLALGGLAAGNTYKHLHRIKGVLRDPETVKLTQDANRDMLMREGMSAEESDRAILKALKKAQSDLHTGKETLRSGIMYGLAGAGASSLGYLAAKALTKKADNSPLQTATSIGTGALAGYGAHKLAQKMSPSYAAAVPKAVNAGKGLVSKALGAVKGLGSVAEEAAPLLAA